MCAALAPRTRVSMEDHNARIEVLHRLAAHDGSARASTETESHGIRFDPLPLYGAAGCTDAASPE